MRFPVVGAGTIVLALAVLLLFPASGCREKPPSQFDRNKPPETFLTSAPAESSLSFYRININWAGFDPDGFVAHYQWAITDSLPDAEFLPWQTTTRTDSIFIFNVRDDSQVLGRRFWVRAIDNEGRRDDTPAWTFFVSLDAAYPEVQFTRSRGTGTLLDPPGDITVTIDATDEIEPNDTIPAGGSVQFGWTGVDLDTVPGQRVGRVVGFRHKLNTRELDWVGGTLADTAASYANLPSGVHIFYVQALDEAGLATDSFSQASSRRSFVANFDPDTWFETVNDTIFWSNDGGHFAGDTLGGESLRSITAHASAKDRDGSVAKLQYRLGGDNWTDKTDAGTTNVEVSASQIRQGNHDFAVRGVDNLSRPDGTEAKFRFYVGYKPIFYETYFEPVRVINFVQFPRDGDVVTVGPDGKFTVKFFARDTDGTVAGYAFSLDDEQFGGYEQALTVPDQVNEIPAGGILWTLQLPEGTEWEGEHTLTVRATDDVREAYTKNPRCEDCYNEQLERCNAECMREAGKIHFIVVRQAGGHGGRSQ